MPKTSNETKRFGPNNRTRDERVKPKRRKKWIGRVAMREFAKVLDRLDETAKAFEIRERIRAEKRDRPWRPRLKGIREELAAEADCFEDCGRKTARLKRDERGRFAPKSSG